MNLTKTLFQIIRDLETRAIKRRRMVLPPAWGHTNPLLSHTAAAWEETGFPKLFSSNNKVQVLTLHQWDWVHSSHRAHSSIWWVKWYFWKALVQRGCQWPGCGFCRGTAPTSSSEVGRVSLPRHTLAQPGLAASPGASSDLFSPPLFVLHSTGQSPQQTQLGPWSTGTPAQSFSKAVLTLNTVQASLSPALLPQRDSHSTTCSAVAPAWMPPAAGSDSAGVQ